jgi:acylphosphatase
MGVENVRARVVIEGRVQGVAFRASTQHMARKLGLSGWVRNLDTGDVEAAFEGPRATVETALAWCRHGPPAARVTACEVRWEPLGDATQPFEVRYD